ncbi:MAG: hypothetical protein HON90_10245, partial [Halobacteriovoraceae bacterium]|nr:hypothetical protein [Halobacteriovoraceae bacterium]
SLLKGPNYYKPSKDIKRLKNRVNAVFKRLQKINLVSKRGKDIWSDNKWELFQADYILRSKEGSFFSYYQMSKNSETMLEPFEEIVLYNAIDRNKKRLAKRIKGADVAIKVLIADKSCDDFECENLFSYYSKIEREKRAAMTSEYHQVGSLLKPIVYDSFIELGRSYDEEISTESFTLHLKSGPWKPRDYSKAKDKTITLKKALQKSKNIPIIKVANEIGFDLVEEKLAERFPRLQKPLSEYPAQLLGALELSLEEVLQVYGRFIKDKCEHIKENELKLEDTVLFYMSVAGETTISRLARAPLKNAYVFGKTGTSNNGLDNWYFAFDGKEVYVIWFGVESERNNRDLKITGASAAFVIFQDFLNHRGKMISEILCE